MGSTDKNETARRPTCRACSSRHRGLCQGVADHDIDGSAALESAHAPIRIYEEGERLYDQGDPSDQVFNLIFGWVALHRDMTDGRRQIVQFLSPGALLGVEPMGQDLGHSATAITKVSACSIGRTKLDALRHRVPSLNDRFVLMLERDHRRGVEALTSIGRGDAKERIGGLLDELLATAAGETPIRAGAVFRMPLTQRHIAEATGLTRAHVNRVLRQMREERVADLHHGTLTVIDPRKLHALSQADADIEPSSQGLSRPRSGPVIDARASRARPERVTGSAPPASKVAAGP
jgi:CRP/FNR family transcriptional regulator, anaerobic regulatory protein